MANDVQLSMEPIGEAQLGSSPRGSVPPWVAVVSIVIGVLGLLCWGGMGVMSIAANSLVALPEGMPEPSAGIEVFEAGGYIAGVVLGLWLILAGSGAAGRRAWGFTMLRGWAVIRIIVAISTLIGYFYWLDEVVAVTVSSINAQAAQAAAIGSDAADMPSLTEGALRAITIGWICLQALAACIWPLIVLITTRRRGEA
jgi:hypothetical protein